MKDLKIEQTFNTPLIDFKRTGQLVMEGKSIPENTLEFYRPVFDWMEEYKHYPTKEIVIDIRMDFFNTSSSKSILTILKNLEGIKKQGSKVIVNWYFNDEDENLLESGEDFARLLNLEFNFIRTM